MVLLQEKYIQKNDITSMIIFLTDTFIIMEKKKYVSKCLKPVK